ncbi:hypothetical protein [Qipengyuania sphaerica]|uniref:hypothetical protein n=1 Tax=Qipengyuania sphaerica TaxID=2867243 RepID=UPI001C86CDA0|nr:hypothetical protein [Qipengyuania sphaerica]MBX7540084.1 hypothetical protein [Qipengyuania sphaerica]
MHDRLNPRTIGRLFDDPARGRGIALQVFAPWNRLCSVQVLEKGDAVAFDYLRRWIDGEQLDGGFPIAGLTLVECAAAGLILREEDEACSGEPQWHPGAALVDQLSQAAGDLLRDGVSVGPPPPADLASSGLVEIPHCLDHPTQEVLREWYGALFDGGWTRPEKEGWRLATHGDPVGRELGEAMLPAIEQIAGEELRFSYCFAVEYGEGHGLARHADREQCQISVTVPIEYLPAAEGDFPWPLAFYRDGKREEIVTRPGNALVFLGQDIEHEREPLPAGHRARGLFLHYVRPDFSLPLD